MPARAKKIATDTVGLELAHDSAELHVQGRAIYIDDMRITAFDSQLSTYVYDDKTMRPTAQLDGNNFATLYEYDDQGNITRVKKETERGIKTIKESRSALFKEE